MEIVDFKFFFYEICFSFIRAVRRCSSVWRRIRHRGRGGGRGAGFIEKPCRTLLILISEPERLLLYVQSVVCLSACLSFVFDVCFTGGRIQKKKKFIVKKIIPRRLIRAIVDSSSRPPPHPDTTVVVAYTFNIKPSRYSVPPSSLPQCRTLGKPRECLILRLLHRDEPKGPRRRPYAKARSPAGE